jgi:hypothetical protein
LPYPPPLTDRERAEVKELMELGDRMVAERLHKREGVRDAGI